MFKVYYTVKVLTINKKNVKIWLSVMKRMNNMYGKFYKLLIIGNPHPIILHIQTRGDGEMVEWGGRFIGSWIFIRAVVQRSFGF
jgi:hypothetical protein